MTSNKSHKTIKIGADIVSAVVVLIFLILPWVLRAAAIKGPQDFSDALSRLLPILYIDAIPFVAGLCWLVHRHGAFIDRKLPRFLQSYWLGLLIFICIATPVILLKFRG